MPKATRMTTREADRYREPLLAEYRFTGTRFGALAGITTQVRVNVRSVEFVGGMVEATIQIGASVDPVKVRFTYEEAREADIIERVE